VPGVTGKEKNITERVIFSSLSVKNPEMSEKVGAFPLQPAPGLCTFSAVFVPADERDHRGASMK
jgi:hypothetical protein